MNDFLCHYGIKGMKWGVHRYQNKDGSLTSAGRARYETGKKVFISGSSKTQFEDNPYYRKELPKEVSSEIDSIIKNKKRILVGEAPGAKLFERKEL